MGSSVSVKARTNQSQVFCKKHPSNGVTHFLADSNQLICLTCFNGIPINSTSNDRQKCEPIASYIESVVFKQSESRVIQTLKTVKDGVEKEKNRAKALMSDVTRKRTKLQREIKSFVENAINLLRFLESDLIKRINITFQQVLDEIVKNLNYSKADLESIKKFDDALSKKQDKIVQLQNVADAKIFLKEFMEIERMRLPNPSFVLKLNKRLTLKQIVGNEEGKSNISLGELKVENITANDDKSVDILSDITDDDTVEDITSVHQRKNRFSEVKVGREITNLKKYVENGSTTKSQQNSQPRLSTTDSSRKRPSDQFGLTKMAFNRKEIQDCGDGETKSSSSAWREKSGYGKIRSSSSTVDQTGGYGLTDRSTMTIQESGVTPRNYSVQSRLNSRTPRASKLSITTPSGVALNDGPIIEDDEGFVQSHFEKWKEVELPLSTLQRNITDSVEFENGDMVLCDQKNKELLLLSSSLTHKDTFRFHSNPHNIAAVARDKLVVTLPEENYIMRVDIENDSLIESDYKIHSNTKCRGIEQVNNQIFYTCKNSIFITEGTDSYKIERAFKQPVSLTTQQNQDVLHVCCRGNKSRDERGEIVTLYTKTLKVVSTLFHDLMKDPVSCTIDKHGDLFVCDVQPPSSIHVARDGKYSHVVLGSVNEKYQHIRYIRNSDMFMITENDNNVISFYRLTKCI